MNYKFSSDLIYTSRKTKADYIFDKYRDILVESVIDVGADQMYLKEKILRNGTNYVGVGRGELFDINVDLEKSKIPVKDKSFKTVVCFDVLEHIENIHELFDELTRISNEYIIISLPNPWGDFFYTLLTSDYSDDESIKFYGLPTTIPSDRHRWFFNNNDSLKFITTNAEKNSFELIHTDYSNKNKPIGGKTVKGFFFRLLLRLIFRKDILDLELNSGARWFVLRRK